MSNQVTEHQHVARSPESLGAIKLYGGQALWFPVIALIAFGILFVYSSSSVYAGQKFGNEFLFVKKQFMYLFPGLIAAYVGMKFPLEKLFKHSGKILIAALLLTALTKVPHIGHKVGGASRWILVGPVQFQPSEILKFGALLFVSNQLIKTPVDLHKIWPALLSFGVLLAQPDFGSSVILMMGITAILFIHGLPRRYFALSLVTLLPVIIVVMISAPYRVKRLVTFLDPFADPLGSGFQVIQSLVAVASGGWFGKGLGGSQQKLFFLPEAHTDFIFAVIAEEMGFAGVLIIAIIYGLLYYTILQIINRATQHAHRLLASGILAILCGSTVVNLGVVCGLFPTKGLPLPFISAGGSSLIVNLFLIGILSQIHREILVHKSQPTSPEVSLHV